VSVGDACRDRQQNFVLAEDRQSLRALYFLV